MLDLTLPPVSPPLFVPLWLEESVVLVVGAPPLVGVVTVLVITVLVVVSTIEIVELSA